MQQPARPLVVTLLAAALAAAGAGGPAHGACPSSGDDGVVPGSRGRTYAAGSFYVDDRGGTNFTDWDGDGNAKGLWVYAESNGASGLQRGGAQVVFDVTEARGLPPRIPPVRFGRVSLFPEGFPPTNESSPWAKETGLYDRCIQAGDPDTLVA